MGIGPVPPLPPRRAGLRVGLRLAVAAGVLALAAGAVLLRAKLRPRPRCGPELPHPESSYYGGDVLRPGEVLAAVLDRWCLPQSSIDSVYAALATTDFPFRSMRPGDSVSFRYQGVSLVSLRYFKDLANGYDVTWDSNGAAAAGRFARPVDTIRTAVRGRVSGSLWNTLTQMGERPALVVAFAEILSYEVDFLTETNEGDSFEMVVDRYYVESTYFREGRVHAVHYQGQTGNYHGFYYETPSGHRDYYNERGQSLRKTVLRSPLQFAKVTSHFGMRLHPIHRVYRRHQGVDYGAPTGTPVSAIADGSVTFAGWRGGYGRLVELRHSGGLSSRYGHLSAFGPGIRAGRRVRQGQTVGSVGLTGDATGPHLHFEIRRNGNPVNPLRVIPPRAEPVPTRLMADFRQVKDACLAALSQPAPASDSGR
ncbi:M23 family metallopeptidase [candidate division WOR-3 bacterium]|nr:M23 family metallopeptidase [candidate division WOR-3 bacterium]